MPVFAGDVLDVGAPGLGLLLIAPGAGAILSGLPHFRHTISTAAPAASFSRWRVCLVDYIVRCLGRFFAFAPLPILRGRISDHLSLFIATLLQFYTEEHNRGRIMSLFGLISSG